MPAWMPTFFTIAGLVVILAGVVVLAQGFSETPRSLSKTGFALIVGGVLVASFPQADADQAARTSEIATIRLELSRMDLNDTERIYFLHRLDPQPGFLGARTDVTLEDARAVLAEAQASRNARKRRAAATPSH